MPYPSLGQHGLETLATPRAHPGRRFRVAEQFVENNGKLIGIAGKPGTIGGNPATKTVVARDDGVSRTHRLDKGRLGSSDFVAAHVSGTMKSLCLDHRSVVDCADKYDFTACCVKHRSMIGVTGWRIIFQHYEIVAATSSKNPARYRGQSPGVLAARLP